MKKKNIHFQKRKNSAFQKIFHGKASIAFNANKQEKKSFLRNNK